MERVKPAKRYRLDDNTEVFIKQEESSTLEQDELCVEENFNDTDCAEREADVGMPSSMQVESGNQHNWKQLRKSLDNVKMKRRETQAQETQRRLATGGGPYVPPVCDSNPLLEIAIPSLSHCEQNVGDMDDDGLDSPPIPNASCGYTELILECPTIEVPPLDDLCAASVMGSPIITPFSGGMARGAAVERELQVQPEGLKSYNAKCDKVQALQQEAVEEELATAKLVHDLQLQRMKRESETQGLQLEILRLQMIQQEQALAHRKKMDELEIKIKEQELHQMLER